MTRNDKHLCLPAAGVSAIASYVDAIESLKLGGLFVIFMSGTASRLAVGAVVEPQTALTAVRLLAGLVIAVVAGTVLARVAGTRRKPDVLRVRLPFPYGCGVRECQPSGSGTTSAITVAMGAANTVCRSAGDVRIGVTYMTGALVKRGHRLAEALRGNSFAGFAIRTFTHALHLVTGGRIVFDDAPVWKNVYWTGLAALNPLAAVLLLWCRSTGLTLGAAIILSDVAITGHALYGLGLPFGVLSLQLQTLFFGFSLGAASVLMATKHHAQETSR